MDPATAAAQHPGVPEWLRLPLLTWATLASSEVVRDEWANPTRRPSPSLLQEYETSCQRTTSLMSGFRKDGPLYLFQEMDVDEFLDFIDFLAFKIGTEDGSGSQLAVLTKILSDAGSEWTVATRDGHPSLEKRVPEGASLAAQQAMESGSAGALLAEAWRAVYGRSPDPEEAYEKAIKAVEEAGAEIVSPANQLTTLGTMIRDMTAQGDWRLPLGAAADEIPVRIATALWKGQGSRHGGNNYTKPTLAEAESAVTLAVALVQGFTAGTIARRA